MERKRILCYFNYPRKTSGAQKKIENEDTYCFVGSYVQDASYKWTSSGGCAAYLEKKNQKQNETETS